MCEQCANKITPTDLKIARAIENNRDAFMALMDKIRQDAGGNFMEAKAKSRLLKKELAKEQNALLSNVLMATYIASFFGEQFIDPATHEGFPDAMNTVSDRAVEHGHVYASYKHAMRH